MKNQDFRIKIIEKSRDNADKTGKDFTFAIAMKPVDDSLDIRIWEKRFSMTNVEIELRVDSDVVKKLRMQAAVEVFSNFYQDNFIDKP